MSLEDMLLWTFRLFLGAMAGVIAYQLLNGRINTRGLFYGRRRDDSPYFSPERVQLLMITMVAAGRYLSLALANRHTCQGATACSLPDFDPQWLTLVGSSHAVYLARKAFSITSSTAEAPPRTRKKKGD